MLARASDSARALPRVMRCVQHQPPFGHFDLWQWQTDKTVAEETEKRHLALFRPVFTRGRALLRHQSSRTFAQDRLGIRVDRVAARVARRRRRGEMASLQDLYGVARRLSMEIRSGLEQLEGAEARGTLQSSSSLSRDMHAKLHELTKITQQVESQWRVLVVQENTSKRDIWKRKVEQIVEDCDQYRVALDRFKSRENRRQADQRDRDELMHRVTSDDEFRLLVGQYDAEAGARISLQRSGGMVDELMSHAGNVLGALGDQRERLKGAQHRMLDFLNTMGVSSSLLRVIDRRQRMDAILVYGGMFVVTVVLILMYMWLGRKKASA